MQRAVKSSAYVENAWKNNVPCIEATIRSTEESPKKRPYVKAYFFNRDKTVVSQHHEPGLVSERGETARIPDYLKPRELYRVYFPVTERAASGKDRWSHVIVVMGEGKRAVAEIYPTDDIATYAFREKAFALYKGKEIVPAAPKP